VKKLFNKLKRQMKKIHPALFLYFAVSAGAFTAPAQFLVSVLTYTRKVLKIGAENRRFSLLQIFM